MADASKPIFRKKSLERLSTPDRLDQLLRVVKRRAWIPLLTLGGLLVLAVAWAFFGRIPITVEGTAVLAHPRQVVPLQAQSPGELRALLIYRGKEVKEGDVIALLARTDLEQEIALEKLRLMQFQDRAQALARFNVDQVDQEMEFYASQRERLETRIEAVQSRAEDVRKQAARYALEQRSNLEQTRKRTQALETALQARFESYQRLLEDGLADEDTLVSYQQRLVANRLSLADVDVRLQELALREIQAMQAYERQMDVVADLHIRVEEVELKEQQAQKRLDEAEIDDRTGEEAITRTIAGLESALERQSKIVAESDGTVLEVTVSPGSRVVPGQRIASMVKADPNQTLQALAYFEIADGKKIRKTLTARISPASVQQQRFGSIVGEVLDVSRLPVTADFVVNQVGTREMARMLVGDEGRIEVVVRLDPDPKRQGRYRWTSGGGPSFRISAGTTARVRVTLEERAPITILIPALRGWLGLD